MPRHGENIYKRKDGRWEARYIKFDSAGRKTYGSVYARTYSEVKNKRNEVQNKNNICHTIIEPKSVDALMNEWLFCSKNNLKQSSFQKYSNIINLHINPFFNKVSIEVLTSSVVQKFADYLISDNNSLSRSTVNDILLVLNMGLSYAKKEYGVNIPHVSLFKIPKKEMQVLSAKEQTEFVSFLLKQNNVFSLGIIVSLYTGLRIGELCALKWEDIFDGKIAVTKTMQRIKQDTHTKIEIMPPKTESSNRIIPMPEQLIPYVENQRKESGYFLQRDNGDFTEPRLLQMKFKRYTEECGIPSMNFHALRHTYATRCMESGVDVKTLSELLGHRDIKTTLNKYVHSSMEQKVSSVNRLKII